MTKAFPARTANAAAEVTIIVDSIYYTYIVRDEATRSAFVVDCCEDEAALFAKDAKERFDVDITKFVKTKITHEAYADPKPTDFRIGDMKITPLTFKTAQSVNVLWLVEHYTTPRTPLLFTGNIICVGGCGGLYDGTEQELADSYKSIIKTIPPHSYVFPNHDNSYYNLKFATHIDPYNPEVHKKYADVVRLTDARQPVCPSTLQQELTYNPLLRTVHCPKKMPNYEGDILELLYELRFARALC